MNYRSALWIGIFVLAAGAAWADEENRYGTPEDAQGCLRDGVMPHDSSWKSSPSESCSAEIARRAALCLKDPAQQKIYGDPSTRAHKDPPGYCKEVAENLIESDGDQLAAQRKAVKEASAAQGELAKREMPRGKLHDPKLERAVAAAYRRAYPDNKVLQVVLFGWSEDLERDVLGHVTGRNLQATVVNRHPDGRCELHDELWLQAGHGHSFAGPLSARGAGSMQTQEILCAKVEKSTRKHR